MTVRTFVQTDYQTQTVAVYPDNVDADVAVFSRIGRAFAPHEQASPNMTVRVDPGAIFNGTALIEVAAQSTATLTAPTTHPRIDRVVIDMQSGAASVVTGTEAASPVAPAIPAGKTPVAQVQLATSTTAITNAVITDERVPVSATRLLPRDYIGGLRVSNNTTDAAHDLDIAPGEARAADNTDDLILNTAITKRIDANWAVGNNAGGLDSGSVAANSIYAIWLIKRSDTGVVDVLFSTSFTSPTMPSNYDRKRLIGAWLTQGDADLLGGVQSGDYFDFNAYLENVNDSSIVNEQWKTGTLTAPPLSLVHIFGDLYNPTATTRQDSGLRIVRKTALAMPYWYSINVQSSAFFYEIREGWVMCDENRQVQYTATVDSGSATITIRTFGFIMYTRSHPV
jgi:hypothetical protein